MPAQVFAPSGANNSNIPDKPRDWYSYPLTFGTIAPSPAATSIQSQNINISAASDFYLTAIEHIAMVTGVTTAPTSATRVLPLLSILLTDTGSGRQLMNAPILLPSLSGDGAWPHRLLMPRYFQRNSNIQVTIQSLDPTNTYSALFLNFEGFVIYQ